ncbi:actin-like atpase domain-containing protein [Diaporthe eres]|nr:actin-like atpase domain-containing protein [Diaporthe eres]
MMPIKPESPSPSPIGEGEEAESYDLYTSDNLEAVKSSEAPTNNRKRPSTASGATSSRKRACGATSKNQASQPKAQPRDKPRTKTPTIVIGSDFGTTCTGVGYWHTGNPKRNPKVFTRCDRTKDHVKTPSVIKFEPQDDIWGVPAKHLPGALRWFKLLLVDPQDLDEGIRTSKQLQEARVALEASGKSAVKVISIFLKRMFEHAVKNLKIEMGAETVDSSRFHVVFTVPAIWPESARRHMKKAVDHSGILKPRPIGQTTHDYISEPEAAALATLADFNGLPNEGDTIVVVDCGGGTVDIITYKIIKTKPMTVQEVVTGKGALCGAIFVEERFKELVIRKLEEISEDAMEHVSPQDIQKIMTNHWEDEIRDDFSGAAKTWEISQPFSLISKGPFDRSGGYPTFTITSEEVEEVFRPSVEQIGALVNSQIDAAVKTDGNFPRYAILVGGFGSSGYLREYLMHHCQGVEVLQCRGWEPWSSICRGAVIHGMTKKKLGSQLRVEVASRIARESCGVAGEEPYDAKVHPPEDKWFDLILRKDVCIRLMKWHVQKGDRIQDKQPIRIMFTRFLEETSDKTVSIVTKIYKSQADQPSRRLDESVTTATELTWNIQVNWDSLETFENEVGKRYKKLEYTVEMEYSAGATAFSIYHRGRKQAAKNVSLKFND